MFLASPHHLLSEPTALLAYPKPTEIGPAVAEPVVGSAESIVIDGVFASGCCSRGGAWCTATTADNGKGVVVDDLRCQNT